MQDLSTAAISTCTNTKAVPPDQAHASALRRLFASSTGSLSTDVAKKRSFDPANECVFANQQKKKKKARQKTSRVQVIVISDLSKGIPKRRYKTHLAMSKRIVGVDFTQTMTPDQVRREILTKTAHLDVRGFSFLDCNGQRLVESANQAPDGATIISNAKKRKGSVFYIYDPPEDVSK